MNFFNIFFEKDFCQILLFDNSNQKQTIFQILLNRQIKSRMTPQEYQKFKISLKQTQQRGAKMLQRIDQTLIGVKDTLQQIKENNQNIEKFEKSYAEVMTQLAEKLAASFCNPFKKIQGKKYEHLPQEIPIKKLVEYMLKQKDILIITGAGVSAPSGIPTFRGKNGLYNKKFEFEGKQYQPQEFITNQFYQKHPKPIWDWIQQIYQMAITCKSNKIHTLIDKLAKVLNVRGKNVTIVTQNIDDLHIKPTKEHYKYFDIHGNVKFVRCENLHLSPYAQFRQQIKSGKDVKCPNCQLFLRPHVLFFDQSYGPLYGNEVKDKTYPFVFVIGSSLSTGLCSKLTQKAIEVVQINPEPVIQVGKVYQYKKESQATLEQILKCLGEIR